jgi:hypothetical protein
MIPDSRKTLKRLSLSPGIARAQPLPLPPITSCSIKLKIPSPDNKEETI